VTGEVTYDFDIALSFAGEDREFVAAVAAGLSDAGIRVFYDEYEKVTLWGKDLYTHLTDVYCKRARYTLLFASKHYESKLWTTLERRAAQARALQERSEYILPVRFDDTEIPGLLHAVGYIDLRKVGAADLVEMALDKLGRRLQSWQASPTVPLPGQPGVEGESLRLRAVRLAAEEQIRRDRRVVLRSEQGIALVQAEVLSLGRYVAEEVAELRRLDPAFDARYERDDRSVMLVSSHRASFTMYWSQQYANALDQAALIVREFDFAYSLAGRGQHPVEPPAIVYEFDVDEALQPIWRAASQRVIRLTSKQLADRHLSRVLDRVHGD